MTDGDVATLVELDVVFVNDLSTPASIVAPPEFGNYGVGVDGTHRGPHLHVLVLAPGQASDILPTPAGSVWRLVAQLHPDGHWIECRLHAGLESGIFQEHLLSAALQQCLGGGGTDKRANTPDPAVAGPFAFLDDERRHTAEALLIASSEAILEQDLDCPHQILAASDPAGRRETLLRCIELEAVQLVLAADGGAVCPGEEEEGGEGCASTGHVYREAEEEAETTKESAAQDWIFPNLAHVLGNVVVEARRPGRIASVMFPKLTVVDGDIRIACTHPGAVLEAVFFPVLASVGGSVVLGDPAPSSARGPHGAHWLPMAGLVDLIVLAVEGTAPLRIAGSLQISGG